MLVKDRRDNFRYGPVLEDPAGAAPIQHRQRRLHREFDSRKLPCTIASGHTGHDAAQPAPLLRPRIQAEGNDPASQRLYLWRGISGEAEHRELKRLIQGVLVAHRVRP